MTRFLLLAFAILKGMTGFASAEDKPRRWFLDPKLYESADEGPVLKKAQERAAKLDEAGVEKLVDRVITGQLEGDDQLVLEMLEGRTRPALIKALRDQRVMNKPASFNNNPVEDLWDLLEPMRPVEAIEPLAALLDAKSYWTRAQAAFAIGYIADERSIEPLRKAIEDPETHVMQMAMNGIGNAVKRDDIKPAVRGQLFDVAASVLDVNVIGGSNVASTLVAVDRKRAAELLLAPERLNAVNPCLWDILKAIDEAKLPIPPAVAARLCDELEKDLEGGRVIAYSYALRSLARSGEPSARHRIAKAMESPIEYLRDYAPEAMLTLEGVEDAYRVAFDRLNEAGSLERTPEPIRAYLAANFLNNEVNNGGFEQYFANSSGDDWRIAKWGYELVGDARSREIVAEVIGWFGPAGPPADRAARVTVMNRWPVDRVQRLRDLESDYYKQSSARTRKFMDWVIAHREHFRVKPTP